MSLAKTNNAEGAAQIDVTNDIYLTSDLHLADGQGGAFGKFKQGENFFWDGSFQRFLETIASQRGRNSQTLVIDGDFLDFLRVDHVPDRTDQHDQALVARWAAFLTAIQHPSASSDLYETDTSEREYGLKTHDFKSAWKLLLIADGHKVFFTAVRKFLESRKNGLFVVKGNHDLELHWEAVRQALVYCLANEDPRRYDFLNDRIRFFQQSVTINNTVYVEHGHRFTDITWCTPDTLQDREVELFLPVGSLFNRYVINKIEAIEPLFDNIKPPTNILVAVALHYPKKLLRIIGVHFVGAWRIVRKSHIKYAAKIIGKIFSIGLPVIVFGVLVTILYFKLQDVIADDFGRWILNTVVSLLGAIAVRWIQSTLGNVDVSASLASNASAIAEELSQLRLIVFGHTHTSEMTIVANSCWYMNSGTWIPNIEIGTNKVEDANTFCVLRVKNESGELRPEPLLRWNNEIRELQRILLFEA